MTALDWIIIAFTGLMGVWGYAQGLIVGALSLVGFAGGAFLGSRLGPLLLEEGSQSPYAPLFALIGALLIGGILASGLELLGFHLRHRLGDRLGVLDGVAGAVLVACLGLGLVWIAGAVALQTPGARELREPIQRSAILSELNEHLPPSGPILQALARFDPFPEIDGPAPNVPPPDSAIARDPEVRRAGRSVVRVLGTACGLGVQGSGWVAGGGVVVTNAHVVAGQDDTTVQLGGEGDRLDTEAIWFDARNDLALLRVAESRGCAAAAAQPRAPMRAPPRRFSASPRTAPTTSGRAASARPPRWSPRMPTAAGRCAAPSRRCAAWCARATRAVRWWTAAAAWSRRSSPRRSRTAGRSGYGIPIPIVRDALSRASGPVDTGPCAR